VVHGFLSTHCIMWQSSRQDQLRHVLGARAVTAGPAGPSKWIVINYTNGQLRNEFVPDLRN